MTLEHLVSQVSHFQTRFLTSLPNLLPQSVKRRQFQFLGVNTLAVTNTTPNPARLLSASPPNGPGARALGAVTASGATDARAPAPPPGRGPRGDLHARRPSEYEPARDVPLPLRPRLLAPTKLRRPGHGPRASVSCYAPPHCPRSPRPRRATLPAGGRPMATHSLPALCSGDFSDSQMTATRSMFSLNIAVPEAFAPHPT